MGHSLLSFPDLPEYSWAVLCLLVAGILSFVVLLFVPAPYGRYFRSGWGPSMPAQWGWVLMEAVSPLGFSLVFLLSANRAVAPLILAGLWWLHYGYRSFVFPFRMRSAGKRKPLLTVALALVFNIANGTTNAFAITELAPHLSALDASITPRFCIGLCVFAIGFVINQHSDHVLLNLREPGETGYKIPRGGVYRFVSSPNYLGEIIEWTGFAIAAFTLPAFVFAFFTAANLVPRALTHHRWYQDEFESYPKGRKAIIPFVL